MSQAVKRVFSFGRRSKPTTVTGSGTAPTDEPSTAPPPSGPSADTAATTPAGAAAAAAAAAAVPKKGISIRRNLSFRREKGTGASKLNGDAAPAQEPAAANVGGGGGEPAASVAATPSRQPLASVRQNSPGIGGIRRTFSWQRGHRQAQRAAAKEAAVSAAKTLLASAPVLAPLLSAALPRLERTRLAMTDKAMLAALRAAAARPPPGPRPVHAAGSHEGGEGGRGKENQDTYFVAHPSAELAVYAVLDGHGKRFGQLAARVAASTIRAMLCHHHRWVVDQPEAALRAAFAEAHDAIRVAMLRADPKLRQVNGRAGPFLLQWVEEQDGEPSKWDAVDGGTTTSVVLILRNEAAIIATVGDSSVLMLGRRSDDGAPATMLLLEEHSPTSLKEYERLRSTSTSKVRFVYDCPDFEEFEIFELDTATGGARLSTDGLANADAHECMTKNVRNDRFTLLAIPEEALELGALPSMPPPAGLAQKTLVDEQAITMTRSLGDFYAHHHGVTSEPELRTISLRALGDAAAPYSHIYLGSDGVWDLWGFDEFANRLLPPTASPQLDATAMGARHDAVLEETRAIGLKWYGERADNLTGVWVELPLPSPVADPLPAASREPPPPLSPQTAPARVSPVPAKASPTPAKASPAPAKASPALAPATTTSSLPPPPPPPEAPASPREAAPTGGASRANAEAAPPAGVQSAFAAMAVAVTQPTETAIPKRTIRCSNGAVTAAPPAVSDSTVEIGSVSGGVKAYALQLNRLNKTN